MCGDLVCRKHATRQAQGTHAMLRKENANVQQGISPARQGSTAESSSSASSTVSRQPFQAIQPSPTRQTSVSSSHAAHTPAQKTTPDSKGLERIAGGMEHAVPAASRDQFSALTDSPVAVAEQAAAVDCDSLSCSSLSATSTASKAQVHAWHPTDAQQASASADNSDPGTAAGAGVHTEAAAAAMSAARGGTSRVPPAAATQLGDSAACAAQPSAASGSHSSGTYDLHNTTATSEDTPYGSKTADATDATDAVPDNATSKADDAAAEAVRPSKPRGAGKVQKQAKARGSTVEVNLLVADLVNNVLG